MPFFLQQLRQFTRRLRLRTAGLTFTADARLESGLVLRPGHRDGQLGSIAIGPSATLDTGVVLDAWGGSIALGSHVFVGPYTVIYGHGGVTIGDDALVSMHCRILSSNHSVPAIDRHIRWESDVLKPTRIGRDVWLGACFTVLGGVTIGDGCVVGAGAVVTKDLPPGAIAYGVPALVKSYRSPSA